MLSLHLHCPLLTWPLPAGPLAAFSPSPSKQSLLCSADLIGSLSCLKSKNGAISGAVPEVGVGSPFPSLSRFRSHHLLYVLSLTLQIILGFLSRARALYVMAFLILNFNDHSFICTTSSRDPVGNQALFVLKYSIWSRF